jgi:hypothetical protein
MADEREWPTHIPDDCPPPEAEATEGNVYRLVRTDPPTAKDMTSWKEMEIESGFGPCVDSALSCSINLLHAQELRISVPRFKNRKIAVLAALPEHGRIKQTTPDPGHHSLWLRRKVLENAHELFQVLT